ncbi:LysR family transcriptional regulator [Shewanella sp. NFH-SH190041]|uniref:LysR substrate-binding domain-containing protein n=1 Tax=Shewanella sp. NFH-SH190041 TaxID=2950245 RepID=UPI0021C2ADE9|nr:LysR substrate-binding domain-containing protein [Shewanella sp. NFH-SH190041]BDM65506.1 LysR family transcriptional regulator [Shewanella sp. NFH-SH190041]
MDLKVIRQFMEIADAGGFGKAADKIHLSQPALSKAMQQLEQELGLTLLERGKRGTAIRLTEAGEVVYRHGQELLNSRKRMLAELAERRQLKQGTLRLGLAPLGSAELFAPVIARYRARYPQIDMQLMARGGVEQTQALQQGDIELATGIIAFGKEFDGIHIRREPMVAAIPKQHELADAAEIRLSMLARVPQIMFTPEYALHDLITQACLSAGFNPWDVTQVSYPDFGLALVAAGGGVMILPRLIAERHSVSGVVTRPLLDSELHWQLSLFWRAQHPLSFAARAMIEMVSQHVIPPLPDNGYSG